MRSINRVPPVMSALESRTMLAAAAAVVTAFAGSDAHLTDADGSAITLSVQGPGTVTAKMRPSGRFAVTMRGASSITTLSIDVALGAAVRGADARATLDGLAIRGSVGTIAAPNVDLRGTFAAESVAALEVRSLAGANLSITRTLGRLDANRVSGSVVRADHIGAIRVEGDVTASRFAATPTDDTIAAVRNVTVTGNLTDSTVFALGDIGRVTARSMINCNVTAGVRIDESSTATSLVQPLPDARNKDKLYDFTGKYRIGYVGVLAAGSDAAAFYMTNVGAYSIGNVVLNGVDGRGSVREFGVAGYRVNKVQRHFESKFAAYDGKANPPAAFRVRQISAPLNFNPGSGSYGGPTGAVVVGDGGHTIPMTGLLIGTVEDHAARDVYINHDEIYELRSPDGSVVVSSPSLHGLILLVFPDAAPALKVENVSGADQLTIRVTSIGPCIKLNREELGRSLWNGRQTAKIPPAAELTAALERSGRTVLRFGKALLLITEPTFEFGKLIDVAGTGAIGIDQSMGYVTSGASSAKLDEALARGSAAHIGSRRLPPRAVVGYEQLVIYGLPNGGTAFITHLGRTALNRAGDLSTLPGPVSLKQSLIDDRDWTFAV